MHIQTVAPGPRALALHWTDGSVAEFPYLFLRDNCPSAFHPVTAEREFDLLSVSEDLAPRNIERAGDTLLIDWGSDEPHRSCFTIEWLADHAPGRRRADPADVVAETWGAEFIDHLPRFDCAALFDRETAVTAWLEATKRLGLSLVRGMKSDDVDAVVGRRFGHLRRTNFGVNFRVESMPDPNNLAYTSHALPLHTDLPNQELPPGFQFLHCVANDADGGDSVFADGYRVAENVRENDRDAFDLLSRVPIPYRFHDKRVDLRVHRPLIGLDERGRIFDIRYSAHLAAAFDMEAAAMVDYYRAYRVFMAETRRPENQIRFKLDAGEMVVFDNRRVLHGRTAFNPASGYRLLSGFYVDRGEFDSTMRMSFG